MGNVLSPYNFSLQGGYPQGTDPETYGVYEFTWGGWTYGAQGGATIDLIAANELKASYPALAGGVLSWSNQSTPSTSTLFVEFSAKMPGTPPGGVGGIKFLKIFGDTPGQANCTFGLDYSGGDKGAFREISYGDGTVDSNDTQNVIRLDGSSSAANIGRSSGTATVLTPQNKSFASADWGTGYHTFKAMVKFNSGTTAINEVADGEFYLEIDGDIYVDATGLFNRHYSNGPIKLIEFFGFMSNGVDAFDMTIKDPYFSTSGFSS